MTVHLTDDDPPVARFKLTPMIAVQVVAWLVAALLTYGAMSSRVAVIETRQGESDRRQSDTDRRMERIENKLDRILERLK